MTEDLSDIINNVKSMMDNGNIPDNLKEMLGNLNSSSSGNTTFEQTNTSPSNSNLNIDFETILKMKTIIESFNQKDDPRTNLLYSLKPYLRESRKDKLDQYVNLLNIAKITDIIKAENKEKNNNA